MKALTREWLDRAADDLNAARLLLMSPDLTHRSLCGETPVVYGHDPGAAAPLSGLRWPSA
jgi:hypothetical protein